MPEKHYNEFRENIVKRDEHRKIAEEKRRRKSKIPGISALEDWLVARHESKAEGHERKAFEAAEKHAQALKEKHKE
ncbi:MAG: hypothetical protein AABW99_01855 [archaeon]